MHQRFIVTTLGFLLVAVIAAATLPIEPTTGRAYGTIAGAGSLAPTFSEHIAKIIYAHCTVCHRDGEIAPFPLVSYHDVATRANLIAAVTGSGEMPPWKADRNYGSHADVRGLTADEIALLKQWADAGAPPGDLGNLPPAPTYAAGSQLGTPDLVLKMSEPYKHSGKDIYRCFVLPTGLLADKEISAIEFRPGNPAIVHHALLFLDTAGAARKRDAADPGPGYTSFGGAGFTEAETYFPWVPGATPRLLPLGLSQKMYRNSDLVIQIHYAPIDHEESDQSSVNIFFAKTAPIQRPVMQFVMLPSMLNDGPFVIPANQVRRFTAEYQVPADVSVLAVAPHMHLLGREMKAYCVRPEGDTIPLVWIRDWDFHWQGGYTFRKLVKVPAGSTLVVESRYDNTPDNPSNPSSPPKSVAWGESTLDEMMVCYFFYTIYLPGDENVSLETGSSGTGGDHGAAAHLMRLECIPNPMTSSAHIDFTLGERAPVKLTLYDVLGRSVATLADATMDAGSYTVPIGRGTATAALPDGSYICRLTTGSEALERLIVFKR